MWRNIGRPSTDDHHRSSRSHAVLVGSSPLSSASQLPCPQTDHPPPATHHAKPTQHVSFDCSRSSRGLFVGILALIATVISMVVFFALLTRHDSTKHVSVLVMYVTELSLYVTSAVAVVGAAHGLMALRSVVVYSITK